MNQEENIIQNKEKQLRKKVPLFEDEEEDRAKENPVEKEFGLKKENKNEKVPVNLETKKEMLKETTVPPKKANKTIEKKGRNEFEKDDELIYSKGYHIAPQVKKTPVRGNDANKIHNAKAQVSLKSAIKERTNPIQINAKQMEDNAKRQQDAGNKMNEDVQKASDEEERIREEKELQQMHQEETAAELRAMETIATGMVAVGTIDVLGKSMDVSAEKEKPGIFGKIAGFFKSKPKEEEIIETELPGDDKLTSKRAFTEKEISEPDRDKMSATMEKLLAQSEAQHALSAQNGLKRTKVKEKSKGYDDTLMPQR